MIEIGLSRLDEIAGCERVGSAKSKGVFGMGNPKVSTRLPLTPMISMLGSAYSIVQIARSVKEN